MTVGGGSNYGGGVKCGAYGVDEIAENSLALNSAILLFILFFITLISTLILSLKLSIIAYRAPIVTSASVAT